ncbi:gustatory and pheromone receptor 32a-like [Vespula squamosa]|uniref:Gustatory receptor n=1 Tax=Vespula squamosa TaxID=30214 RepID=A0ABD2B0K6_VESSQ
MSLSEEFRHSIKPLIIMNSIFTTGLIEYFVDDKINGIGIVHACFSIIFYISMVNVISFSSVMFQDESSLLIKLTYQLYVYSDYTFYIVTIIAGILRRKKIKLLTLQIETCIRSMDQLNLPMNLSKCLRQQYYIILTLVLILISMIMIDYKWLNLLETRIWSLLMRCYIERYPFIILLVTDVTFVFWMRQIKFSQLNELLKGMLTANIDSPQHKKILRIRNNRKNDSPSSDIHRTYKSNENVVTIKKAKKVHLELIKCAKNVNDAYGLHILMSVSTTFILITVVSYNIYYHIITGVYRTQIYQFVHFLYWISYLMFKIIIVSHVCERTIVEVCSLNIHYIFSQISTKY